jgi:hypothetical protein
MIIKNLVRIKELKAITNKCYSLLLDGVNEYIDCTNNVAFDFERTDSFSLSGWVKLNGLIGLQSILRKKTFVALSKGWFLSTSGNEIRFDLQNNGGVNGLITITSGANLSAGVWYHIAATYSGNSDFSGVNIYLNGALQTNTIDSNTLTATIKNTTFVSIGGPSFFNGNIANARMWNTELTSIQISAEYNSGRILSPAVQGANLILDTDINNATFGTEWEIPDVSGITAGYESVNMEIGDRVEDCPS